jgi:hypothetical protein
MKRSSGAVGLIAAEVAVEAKARRRFTEKLAFGPREICTGCYEFRSE